MRVILCIRVGQPKAQASLSSLGGFTGKQLSKELEPTADDVAHEKRATAFRSVSVDEVIKWNIKYFTLGENHCLTLSFRLLSTNSIAVLA